MIEKFIWFIDWLFLCKIAGTHPVPSDKQLLMWLEEALPFKCRTCGKMYEYDK